MKKKLFTYLGLSILSLFVGFSQVNAEDNSNVLHYDNWYNYYPQLVDIYTNYQTQINTLIDYYNEHLSSDYAGYVIYYYFNVNTPTDISTGAIYLAPTTDTNFYPSYIVSVEEIQYSLDLEFGYNPVALIYDLRYNTFTYQVPGYTGGTYSMPRTSYIPLMSSEPYTYVSTVPEYGNQYDKIVFPSYSNDNLDASYPSYELVVGDTLPTFETLYDGSYDSYTEINVNDYAYVVLSLKNYNQDTFWTNIYTQGRLCLTPVYNYGMTQRQDILTGSINQGCTTRYDTLTPVNVSIIQSDIDNHAVYYIVPYNNEATTIRVDTNVFDITYISQSDANNPSVIIGGRSYPVIPYSQLTDTANISTDNNYVSGQVCNPGDVNCASTITGLDISDLFTQPLELFRTLGSSITSVLSVITTFIMFLPPTLQAFLYTGFFLVIILGIIKVIL